MPPASQTPLILQVLQGLFWLFAIGGAIFAVYKHFAESAERRVWEKAKLAKQMLGDLDANPKALAATYMLGAWTGRRYARDGVDIAYGFEVTQAQVIGVLDVARSPQTRNEQYVRECFDNLLFHVELCCASAERDLVEWSELQPMLATLLVGMSRSTLAPLVMYAQYSCYFRAAARLPVLLEAALTKPAAKKYALA
ncbi:MAG: hypothetical protein V4484_08900 [Pseudomonadota bacterium]